MLFLRFFRAGKKHQPFFKLVATDKRRPPKSGRFREQLGFYNPLTKEKKFNIERIKYWLSVGAISSETVHNLLVKEGVIKEAKIPVHKKPKKKKEAGFVKDAAKKEASPDKAKEKLSLTEVPKEKKLAEAEQNKL